MARTIGPRRARILLFCYTTTSKASFFLSFFFFLWYIVVKRSRQSMIKSKAMSYLNLSDMH